MSENNTDKINDASEQGKSQKNTKMLIIIIAVIALISLMLVFLNSRLKNNGVTSYQDDSSSIIISENENSEVTSTDSSDEESSQARSSKASEVLSSVKIQGGSAQATGYEPLDTAINGILSSITSSGMSANEKMSAIYKYVKNNMTYNMFPPDSQGIYDSLISSGYSDYDATQMALAYDATVSHQGVCDNYSALTMILARAAGIPLYQSGGLAADGSSHAWDILVVDGEKYLIDTNFGRYMVPFSQSGYVEQMDGINYFNNFNTYIPPVEEKKIEWLFNAGFGNQRFYGNSRGEFTQTATINRPMYPEPKTIYPEPICPLVMVEGANNTFSATVSSGGAVIETLPGQSGATQTFSFSWYPPNAGSYVVEITATSDDIFVGHFVIYADITE